MSVTVTVCPQVAVFPFTSVTVHVIVFTPTGIKAGALFTTEAMPQLSSVTGVPRLAPLAPHWPLVAFTDAGSGQAMVGGWLSVTVTLKLQVATAHEFVAVTVTTVVPPLNKVPEAFE